MLQIIKKYLFPDRLAHFAAQQQLTAAMRKAHHNTAADTFGQGANLKSQNSPISMAHSMNANPATFGMQMPSLKSLAFMAMLSLFGLGTQSCEKDIPEPNIENPTITGDLENFVNPELSTWSIVDNGELDAKGNTICTVSAPMPSGVTLGANPNVSVQLNLYDGGAKQARLSETVEAKNFRVEGGQFKFELNGPLPTGSNLMVGAGTFANGGVENEDALLIVRSGQFGSVSPVRAVFHYKGFGISEEAQAKMSKVVFPNNGADLAEMNANLEYDVDYSQLATQPQKIAATQAAVEGYLTSKGYTSNEASQYSALLNNSNFMELTNNDLQLASYYFAHLDGTPLGLKRFERWTQFSINGPLTNDSENFRPNGGVSIRWDATGAFTQNAAMVTNSLNKTTMYLHTINKKQPIGNSVYPLVHEDIHWRTTSGGSSSRAEELFAGIGSIVHWIEARNQTPSFPIDISMNEAVAFLFGTSGANGRLGVFRNPRVEQTNGNKPWLDGVLTDGRLSYVERNAYSYPNLADEGGDITEQALEVMKLMTQGNMELPSVGAPYTYQLIDNLLRVYTENLSDQKLQGIFDHLGLTTPSVGLN